MSYHWPEQKLVFLAQPRTGSHAIAEWMCQRGAVMRERHHTYRDDVLQLRRDDGWTIFTAVRNHWDVLVSWWYLHRARRVAANFESFVHWWITDNSYLRPHQLYWNYQPRSDVILRYETLEADLSLLMDEDVTLPRENVTASRRPAPVYYEAYPGLAEFVGEWFADEIELYGYRYEDVLAVS